jgi:signal peptidase I
MGRVRSLSFWCLGTAVLWVVVQVFGLTSFYIPTDSMLPELLPGDVIIVNKLSYGARLFNVFIAAEGRQVNIQRLPGMGDVQRNDVVVFNYPCPQKWKKIEMDIMQYYVKRCIALPGDVFRIENGQYKVSGYHGLLGNVEEQKHFMEIIIREQRADTAMGVHAYPGDYRLGWTVKNLGPFYIPKAGDTIPMNTKTVILYRNIIEWEQNVDLNYKDGRIYLGDTRITGYRFKKNYYFMAGDKVENSKDSRYWGLLPEDYIVGKAWRIWKSIDKENNKTRWNRILRKIK